MGCLIVKESEQWVSMYAHVDAHLEHCRAAGFAATTIDDRRELLARVWDDLGNLHTLTRAALATWLGRPHWSPETRANYFGHLRGYLRWAQREGLIEVNPTDLLDRPKVPYAEPRQTDPDTFTRVIREAVEPYLTAALLAGYAGLRCFEIAKAEHRDVTEERIRVQGKGGRVDEIPTHPDLWQHLRGRTGLLVRDTRGRPYSPNALSSMFGEYVRDKLGIPDLSLHRLRHLYGNTLRQVRDADGNAIDIEVIRTLMRHRSLATTQRYLCTDEGERRMAIRALPSYASHREEAA